MTNQSPISEAKPVENASSCKSYISHGFGRFLLVVSLSLLFSCEKETVRDAATVPNATTKRLVIDRITIAFKSSPADTLWGFLFNYDSLKRVTTLSGVKYPWSNAAEEIVSYHYHGTDTLPYEREIVSPRIGQVSEQFEYDPTGRLASWRFGLINVDESLWKFTYGPQIIYTDINHQASGNPSYLSYDTAYFNSSGDQERAVGTDIYFSFDYSMTWDQHPSPFSLLNIKASYFPRVTTYFDFIKLHYARHTLLTFNNNLDSVGPQPLVNLTYTYNGDGYPVTQDEISVDQAMNDFHRVYFYKKI